jgi:hypothetical protein
MVAEALGEDVAKRLGLAPKSAAGKAVTAKVAAAVVKNTPSRIPMAKLNATLESLKCPPNPVQVVMPMGSLAAAAYGLPVKSLSQEMVIAVAQESAVVILA